MSTYAANFKVLKSLGLMIAMACALFVAAPQGAQAQMASTKDALGEMSIGSPDAPVTLHEYSSLTCGHCANFHTGALPEIKKNYVDTGKVRVVFHDFPLDNLAFAAAMIARCAGPERHFELFDRLYQSQQSWARSDNPRAALVAIARFSGLSAQDVDACLQNEDLAKGIQVSSQNGQDLYAIQSTPTFILEGKKIQGALNYDAFKDELDKALATKGAN